MSVGEIPLPLSPAEYLAGEELSPIKHEYINGYVYAMAGAAPPHVTISMNSIALLLQPVRSRGCDLYGLDMKVYVEVENIYYYPDGVVTCDERDRPINDGVRHPILIIEILSKGTEAFDRDLKFRSYRQLDTLQEYVLIAQDRISIDCFYRNGDGSWRSRFYGPGDAVILESVGFECPIEAFYEAVIFAKTPDSV